MNNGLCNYTVTLEPHNVGLRWNSLTKQKKKVVYVNKWSLCFEKYMSFVFIVFIYTELQGENGKVFLMDIIENYKYSGTEMGIYCLLVAHVLYE